MRNHKKYSLQPFHLPQLKRKSNQNFQTMTTQFSKHQNSLSRYQLQLRSRERDDSLYKKHSKKVNRLKTINVNDHESYDQLRKELRSMKQAVNWKIKQHNHRIENKIDDFIMMSFLKKEQSQNQVVYQPFPMYLPPMYPQMLPPKENNDYIAPKIQQRSTKSKMKSRFGLRNFRKYVFAVLFTVRLKKFANKVISYRKQMFNKYMYESNQFKQQANYIKKILVQGMKPFLVSALQKQDSELNLNQGDSQNFKKEKMSNTKRMVELLIECLRKTVDNESFDSIIRSIYYFCRHGSYSCLHRLVTYEELQNMSISEKHFYFQAEKSLQKSQIINFLFMKILIYNALGQSWKIDPQKFSQQNQILQQNLHLITSIFYEILMDIQDDFIVNSPQCYPLNNFQKIKGAKILPTQSLTLKPGQFRKNQMISGLLNENFLKNTYKLQKLYTREKNQLIEIIQKVHAKICNYHRKLIKPFL